MKRTAEILFFSFFVSISSPSQNLQFKQFTVEDGLPQNTVFSIVQDCTGFMWFGTADGLSRYDGYSFKIFRRNISDSTSLPDNKIVSILINNEKKLISSSQQNLVEFNQEREQFSLLPIPDMISLYSQTEDKAYVLTKQGFGSYSYKSKTFSVLNLNSTPEKIGYFFELKDSSVLIIKSDAIEILEKNGGTIQVVSSYRKKFYSTKYLDLNDSTLLVGMMDKMGDADLFRINKKTFKAEKIISLVCSDNLQTDKILSNILKDQNQKIWLAVHHYGLVQIDLKNGKIIQRIVKGQFGLTSDLIIHSYIDKSQNLWLGTDVSGVFKADLKPAKFKLIKAFSNNRIDNLTKAIYSDGNKYLWLGSYSPNNGLMRFNSENGEIKTYSYSAQKTNSISDNKIVKIVEGKNNQLWITTEKGLDMFDVKSEIFTNYEVPEEPDLIQNCCIWLGEDKNKNNWILSHHGIGMLDLANKKIRYSENAKPTIYNSLGYWNLSGIFYNDTTIFFTSSFGLGEINTSDGKIYYRNKLKNINAEISSFKPKILFLDSKKRIWIGTENGLILWDKINDQSKLFTELDGLPNSYIYGLTEDKNNFLWISTNKGLSRLFIGTDDLNKEVFRNYDVADGLQSNEFNSGAVFKDKNEMIYFAGIGGITYFHPDSVSDNPFKPKTILKEFKVFNQLYAADTVAEYKKNYVLNYDENTLTFEFTSLEFTDPVKNQYKYKLENFDNDWVSSGNKRDVRYTNLFPGKYIFRVKSSNNDGIWNETGSSVSITIVPPFWKTTWFLTVSGIFLFVLAYSGIKTATNRKVKRKLEELKRLQEIELERQKERNRISRDMHDEVGSGLTKIALLSKSILAEENNQENKTANIKKVNETASNLVDNISEIIWAIDPKNDSAENLSGYFRKYASDFFDGTEINVGFNFQEIDRQNYLTAEARRNLFLVYKESLNNIIKHSEATSVEVSLNLDHSAINLKIADNGKGFSSEETVTFRNGLRNMKKRIEECGGKISLISVIGKGTEIDIFVPVKILRSAH